MGRFRFSCTQLILGAFIVGCVVAPANIVMASGIPTNDITATLNRVAKVTEDTAKTISEESKGIQTAIQNQVNMYTAPINDMITDAANAVEDAYNATTEAIDGAVQQAGDAVMSYASDAWSSVSGSMPGGGFTESETFKSIKDSVKKYGKYITPVVKAATGDLLGAFGSARDAFYIKNEGLDELGGYTVVEIQKNLKKYIQDATRVAIADATQIMNGTAQYKKVNDTAKKEGSKNYGEDISTTNDAGMTMNVMTNVLLSMDITDLSIQSAMIYDSINQVSSGAMILGK